jgi:hypothetical protein
MAQTCPYPCGFPVGGCPACQMIKEETMDPLYELLPTLALNDATELAEKDKSYGSSWKKRGGVGAFMMLARKWDRIEEQVEKHSYDVFGACEASGNAADGIMDDISDLRGYLLLVEAEMTLRFKAMEPQAPADYVNDPTANAKPEYGHPASGGRQGVPDSEYRG